MLRSRQISEGRRRPVHNASTAWHFSRALYARRSRFGFSTMFIPTSLRNLAIDQDPHLAALGLQHHVLLSHPAYHIERRLWLSPQRHLLHVGLDPPFHRRPHLLLDREEPIRRTKPLDPLVRSLVVVVLDPVADSFLSTLEGVEPRPLQELLPDRFPEPLDLPERHRMMRRAAQVMDPVLGQLHLKTRLPVPRRVLPPVVREHLLRHPVGAHRPPVHLQHVLRRLATENSEPRDNGVVFLDEDHVMRVNPAKELQLVTLRLDGGLPDFKSLLDRRVHLPPDRRQWPEPVIIRRANEYRRISA